MVAADFQNYIVSIFDRNLKVTYLEYYNRDFKKIWSREFKNVDNISMDYTAQSVYLVADNDLFVVDIESGEDRISPVMVGEKVKLCVVPDGIIMVGSGNNDNIMKTDFEGNIIWKTSVDIDVTFCDMIQYVDGKVVAQLTYSKESPEFDYKVQMVAVGSDGQIISEFTESQYHPDGGIY